MVYLVWDIFTLFIKETHTDMPAFLHVNIRRQTQSYRKTTPLSNEEKKGLLLLLRL